MLKHIAPQTGGGEFHDSEKKLSEYLYKENYSNEKCKHLCITYAKVKNVRHFIKFVLITVEGF
jgi:hypothetical protein